MEPKESWSCDLCGGRLFVFDWERKIRVWTPGQSSSMGVQRALWLNDGQNLFRDEDSFGGASWGVAGTAAHLIGCGAIPEIIIVGIDHTGRNRTYDYLSSPPTGWDAPWGDGMRGDMWDAPGGGVDAYLESVISLLPWAERRFGVSAKPEHRYFGGSSFGGICALYMAMKYPGLWDGVLVESPSFWAGEGRYLSDVKAHASPWPRRMYLAMGEFEYTGFRGTERPGSLECDAYLRDTAAECAGHLFFSGTALAFLLERGGKHNERDWGRRLPGALRWLLGAPTEGQDFWTRPAPLKPGPFELFVRRSWLKLAEKQRFQVHLGFNGWALQVQRCDLLAACVEEEPQAVLAALAYCPPGASSCHFALTNGAAWLAFVFHLRDGRLDSVQRSHIASFRPGGSDSIFGFGLGSVSSLLEGGGCFGD
ncbi:unnamed protein product [Effrenium voratum]|nr:unnamed protein product [Effrenium voratum]